MDSIRFEVFLDGPIEPILPCEAKFARTIINDRPILDIVEECERLFLPDAKAGAYEYQFADDLYRYLTDKSFHINGWPNKTGLLICGCLCEGCWPIYVTMEETGNSIVWKNFLNPHLSGSWDEDVNGHYRGIGPFTFDKSEFWHEVENLKFLVVT